ncbi:MAG: nuclear transport factor 2 family protein [Sphingomonadaceae bacterium]|nr:nuclear transport factor 2 family protein [Sphingomonadaceae bacterium]
MNDAEALVRELFGLDADKPVSPFDRARSVDHIHPDIEFSLFGMSGTKEVGHGRDAYLAFTTGCRQALANHSDEILSVVGIDEQCVFVRARAYRKSAATGEALEYEWATLMRVEDGKTTYVTDILDRDAQAFWGRIAG